jgi:FAD/FMN-containing dehydrogenase
MVMCSDEHQSYNTDWFKRARGQCAVVLCPKRNLQVSQILAHRNNRRLAVVPQGGNTGLLLIA